jgi:hypothetical protein
MQCRSFVGLRRFPSELASSTNLSLRCPPAANPEPQLLYDSTGRLILSNDAAKNLPCKVRAEPLMRFSGL